MPTNLSCKAYLLIPNISPKRLRLTAILLLSPLFFHAQTLTGLWTGVLSNDSNTIRKDQSFEIALTEYRGKVYGYSRSEFIVDDTLYYMVKRVKGTIQGDLCEVTDDEIIAYNFRGKLDKGIKVTSIFRRNKTDSSWYLDGTWKTNATKKYYSVTGKVNLEAEKDLTASKIFPHLEELKLADDVAFYKDRKEGQPIVKIVKPEKTKSEFSSQTEKLSLNNNVAVVTNKPVLERAEILPVPAATIPVNLVENTEILTAVKKPETGLPKTETKNIPEATVALKPSATTRSIAENKKPEIITPPVNSNTAIISNTIAEKKQPDTKVIAKATVPQTSNNTIKVTTETKKQDVASITIPKTNQVAATNTVSEKKETITKPLTTPIIPEIKKPEMDVTLKAAIISGRKSEFTQVVNFQSDSLQLSLYDNGEIDGDTVSVFMNSEVLMSKQGLKASAIRKTIYITPGNED
ncbi:MAG: hypothetical protein ABJA85_07885, partial [Bacteroidota bacterium]